LLCDLRARRDKKQSPLLTLGGGGWHRPLRTRLQQVVVVVVVVRYTGRRNGLLPVHAMRSLTFVCVAGALLILSCCYGGLFAPCGASAAGRTGHTARLVRTPARDVPERVVSAALLSPDKHLCGYITVSKTAA
jgi:hypothetical protein